MNICNKFERLQCNAVVGIAGAIIGSSIQRLYQELGISFSRSRRWLRNVAYFISHQSIFIIMFQQLINPIKLESSDEFLHMSCRIQYFANSFFWYKRKEWSN